MKPRNQNIRVQASKQQPCTPWVREARIIKSLRHLLKIVDRGLNAAPPRLLKNHKRPLKPELRPAVTLLSAWLTQIAADKNIDPALLGSRSDIEELLRGEGDCKLRKGWRQQEVGEQIDNLLNGKSSLAFDDGRLVIDKRGTIDRTA